MFFFSNIYSNTEILIKLIMLILVNLIFFVYTTVQKSFKYRQNSNIIILYYNLKYFNIYLYLYIFFIIIIIIPVMVKLNI